MYFFGSVTGLQYRQCLEFLDEMTELGIQKNVVIFGAATSCMEKCCRPDISFQLMERMKLEGVTPNVHIYNRYVHGKENLCVAYCESTLGIAKDTVFPCCDT